MLKPLPTDARLFALETFEACRDVLTELIGAPEKNFDDIVICESDTGPTIDFDGTNAIIFVQRNAPGFEPTLVANVAHESVHLHLTNGEYGNANGFEEGFAVHFELSIVEQRFGPERRQLHADHLSKSYAIALSDYEYLLQNSDAPAARVRETHGRLTGVTPGQFRQLFPGLGWWISRRLARRKRMRPG